MKHILAAALLLSSTLVLAEEAHKPNLPSFDIAQEFCAIPSIPANAQIIAVEGHRDTALDFVLDTSGNPSYLAEVAVHADQPVVLLLRAHEPTLWNVGWSTSTQIVGAYATGYARQVVAGLPKTTPVVTASYAEGRAGGCGWMNPELVSTSLQSKYLFQRPLTRIYNKPSKRNGVVEIIESEKPSGQFVTSSDRPPESFKDPKAPLAGKAGLDDAVKKGILRPVTAEDEIEVGNVFRKAKRVGGVPFVRPDAYVVLKEFTYPLGFTDHSAIQFVVPPGVPRPTGNPGYTETLDLNTAECLGPMCPAQPKCTWHLLGACLS